MYQVHTAVLIGRFQPFHNGHLALLEQALQVAQQVIVVLGSAHQARSPKNPWVWEERRKMIDDCLPTRMKGRVQFVPITTICPSGWPKCSAGWKPWCRPWGSAWA